MLRLNQTIFIFIVGLSPTPARSETVYDASLASGKARFFGDLSDEQKAPISTLSTRIMQRQDHIQWGLGIQVLSTSTRHTGHEFPYEQGSRLKLLSFFFTPVICSRGQFYACGAIGNGTVNVNATKHRQDYGSWTYQGSLSAKLMESWALSLGAAYVGRVEQQMGERKSEFSFLSILVGLTYGTALQIAPGSSD